MASALVVIALTDSFTQFGFSTPIIQFKEDSIKYINTAWTIDLVRSFIIFIFLFIFQKISNYFENENLKNVLILSLRPIIQTLVNPYLNYEIRIRIKELFYCFFILITAKTFYCNSSYILFYELFL